MVSGRGQKDVLIYTLSRGKPRGGVMVRLLSQSVTESKFESCPLCESRACRFVPLVFAFSYNTHSSFLGKINALVSFVKARLTQCLFVGCLTSKQHASVSQGRICSDNFTYCHTEIEVADQTFHLTQSQYTDTEPTSPSTDPITPGAWQGSHWSANFEVTGMTRPRKILGASGIRTGDLPLSRRTP